MTTIDVEITPCGRGPDSYACGGCDCGLESRQVAQLRAQVAHLTGYADGLKRGSDLHEQARAELADDNRRYHAALERIASNDWSVDQAAIVMRRIAQDALEKHAE